MEWTTLYFGKYKGKTLPQVLFIDPDWFFWAIDEGIFNDKSEALKTEAGELEWKARNILIPSSDRESYEVEYYIHPQNVFMDFIIIPKDTPTHAGPGTTMRSKVIDMRTPIAYKTNDNDKLGYKKLVKCLKFVFFKDKNYKMNKALCEDFFNDDSKFAAK